MGWTYESEVVGHDEWHEGYLAPEFDNGDRGIGAWDDELSAVEQLDDGSYRSRPAGEVIGWRVVCDCYLHANQRRPNLWISQQLWTRVPSPLQHDPASFRIYVADDDVPDVMYTNDIEDVARDLWRREHIDDLAAAGAVAGAAASVRAAEQQLDVAVLKARDAGLSWAKIGAKVGITAQSAHQRWAQLADARSHG
jgi:hypothetical protein